MVLEYEKIKKIIPFLGSIIITCGYIKLNIYYRHFNIKISEYLEISEVLTLFLNDVIFYSLIVFIIFFFSFLYGSEKNNEKKNKIINSIYNEDNIFIRIKFFLFYQKEVIILLTIIFVSFLIGNMFKNANLFYYIFFGIQILIFTISTFLLIEFDRRYKIVFNIAFNSTFYNLIIIVLLFAGYTIQSSYMDINDTESKNSQKVFFVYDSKKIESDDKLLFLGQTNKYLFMFDKISQKTFVFNRNSIDLFELIYEKK